MSLLTGRRCGRDDERGVVAVLFALLLVVMLGVLALVVDLGNARQQRREAQASADSAALAGGEAIEAGWNNATNTIPWATVVTQVKAYAKANNNIATTAWQGCADQGALAYKPDAGNNCISATTAAFPAPSAASVGNTNLLIRVKLPSTSVKTYFAKAIGANNLVVGATAQAKVVYTVTATQTMAAGGPCALCVLNPSGTTLDGQNGDITITGGDVVVNSTGTSASTLGPNGHVKITTPNGHIGGPGSCGAATPCNNFSGSGYSPSWTYHAAVIDPLAHVPQCGDGSRADGQPPSANLCPTNTGVGGTSNGSVLSPGIYSEISGSHRMNPGIYVITCGTGAKNNCDGITLNGNDLLQGSGVMLYFACSNYPSPCPAPGTNSSVQRAGMKVTGNGASVQFAGITANQCTGLPVNYCPEYTGMMIFADRNNTATFTFRGNGTNENGQNSGSSGTIYMKNGTMDLRGNGFVMASQIVSGYFTMNGNPSTVTIAYDLTKTYAETHVGDPTYTGSPDDNGLSS